MDLGRTVVKNSPVEGSASLKHGDFSLAELWQSTLGSVVPGQGEILSSSC